MYIIYKDDPFGNKIPVMVATKPYADRMVQTLRNISKVTEVPRNAQSIIMSGL